MSAPSVPLSLRIPKDDARALEALARATDRPKSYLVQRAIESYIAEYAEYQVALDRLRDKDDEIISSAELRRRLGRGRAR